jgi:hypothetical protein
MRTIAPMSNPRAMRAAKVNETRSPVVTPEENAHKQHAISTRLEMTIRRDRTMVIRTFIMGVRHGL